MFFIGIFSTTISYALNNSVPLYVTQSGGSTDLSGSMITSLTVGGVVGRIFSGRLVDTVGRRKIMIIYSLGFVAVTVLPAFFPSFALLLFVRFMQGLFTSGITTASMAATADVVPRDRMGEGIGYSSLSMIVGLVAGPTLGIALLGSAGGHRALFLASAGIMAVNTALAWNCRYEPRHPLLESRPEPEEGEPVGLLVKIASLPGKLFERKALGPATVGFILALASAVSISYISLYAAAAGIRTEPYFTAQAGGMFLTRISTVRFSDRHPLKIIMPAAAAGAAAFLLIAFTSGAGLFFTAGFLYGLCLGVTIPLLNAAALKSAPPERYGAASSTYSLFFDLAIGVGSLLWGKVVDISHSYTPVFAGGAFFILLGGEVVAYFVLRNKKQTKSSSELSA